MQIQLECQQYDEKQLCYIQQKEMGLQQPLIPSERTQEIKLINNSEETNERQANLKFQQQQLKQSPLAVRLRQSKFIVTFLAILLTSYQVYDITTVKLQHSRNFIRFLNFYLIEHTWFDIYWAGPNMLNYPIQEYMVIDDFNDFLSRFDKTMNSLDEFAYGLMDVDQFLTRKNKIYLQQKKGGTVPYDYVISDGFVQPFSVDNEESIRKAILRSQEIQIVLQPFYINKHKWNLMVQITTFSQTSIFVQIYAHQSLSLIVQHIPTLFIGLLFLLIFIIQIKIVKKKWVQSIPDYLVCCFLINTFFISLDSGINVKWVVILDGIQCCAAWLLILKFVQKQDDYHISFLIRKSYALVGRLFVSFGPIFIAFTVFGYTLFCRQAWQFSTFRRTFLTLFYISYYNATYESFIVTSRANPISMIFFFSFVILFTICVYSGILVSVFCSYVWNKRESKIKQDIVNNLKIQCSQCNYKYKYVDCLKVVKETKRSLKMSFIMQVDFNDVEQRNSYKEMLMKKISYLGKKVEQLTNQTQKQLDKKVGTRTFGRYQRQYAKEKFFGGTVVKINNLLKYELSDVQRQNQTKAENRDFEKLA